MTKRSFAYHLIDNFRRENDISERDCPNYKLEDHIYSSSRLGIALEILDLITDDKDKRYVQSRECIFALVINPESNFPEILTVREILSFLPN